MDRRDMKIELCPSPQVTAALHTRATHHTTTNMVDDVSVCLTCRVEWRKVGPGGSPPPSPVDHQTHYGYSKT